MTETRLPGTLARALRPKLPLLGVGFVLATAVSFVRRGPLPFDVDALAKALGEEALVTVDPRDVRWEASRGLSTDTLVGRPVVFLGRPKKDGPRDVYRAFVRVSNEGKPLEIGGIYNLTSTDSDEHELTVEGGHAAFVSTAFGQVQSVTVLDLTGEHAQNLTEKVHDRTMAALTNIQQTGDASGLGRYNITFEQPIDGAQLSFKGDKLHITPFYGKAASEKDSIVFDTQSQELKGGRGQVDAVKHLPKPVVFWAVDTTRAVPWIGPAPIAWLEEKTFAVRDAFRRAAFKASSRGDEVVRTDVAPAPASVLSAVEEGKETFPPANIPSIWKNAEPGEGEWTTPSTTFLKKLTLPGGEEAPPAFARTFVRPDEERAYAKVLMVAMDTRQVDLDMEAGVEDPKPLTGAPGTGRIPRDPQIYKRIAATFNGGFKTEHGSYGMMVKKRVLLPPVAGAATVAVLADGRIGMGSWGANPKGALTGVIGGIKDVADGDIISMRQNLDPLLDGGVVNPSGRNLWGFTLPGTSMQTERSGICVTQTGHLIYAWGDDVSATTLGKAMKMAGCAYGMHLDMNPHHTGFSFTNIQEIKGRNWKSELLTTKMEISPDRYIEYAPKDFFYILMKEPGPPSENGIKYSPAPGTQPAPKWLPALYRAEDPASAGVDLTLFEPGRVRFRLRAGAKEPSKTAAQSLSATDEKRVLLSVSLGEPSDKRSRTLVVGGERVTNGSTTEGFAALTLAENGELRLEAPTAEAPAKGDLAVLPVLVSASKLRPEGDQGVYVALGILPNGRSAVAHSRDGKGVGEALVRAGATSAVVLDRGGGRSGDIYRAGTDSPPRAKYTYTTLSVLGVPLTGSGFRFDALVPYEQPKKKK
ncbi:MAG: hypothetical protein U0174_18700 [Polyangiaceae bacterium]